LAQQRELADPLTDLLFDFAQNGIRLAVLFRPAGERDDAEGAAVVAAALDGDPGRYLRLSP
jgi:hypothetical protein